MNRKRFSVEQIAAVLKQVEVGVPAASFRQADSTSMLETGLFAELPMTRDSNPHMQVVLNSHQSRWPAC